MRLEIDQEDCSSYERAAEFLNFNGNDLVCLQHEYGIFGGEAGSHILSLIRSLKMPLVTTLHTVLREPSAQQREVLDTIEQSLSYSNARLPEALLIAGWQSGNKRMTEVGLESLRWLLGEQHRTDEETFVPIGSRGFYSKGSEKARFDQQPVEACATVSACLEAYRLTRDKFWLDEAWSAFRWFLGDNDLNAPLYDPATGGCCDGLHPDRVNENQGAESTISFLMALLDMRGMETSRLPQPQAELSVSL